METTGIADVGGGFFESYSVGYRAVLDRAYILIAQSTKPVPGVGTLATWDTSTLDEGIYIVKLTTRSISGQEASDEAVVWVSSAFDSFSPAVVGGTLVGGQECINGTIFDENCPDVEYTIVASGPSDVPTIASSSSEEGLINARLGTWDTSGLADGTWSVNVFATNGAGQTRSAQFPIETDNTPPVARLDAPINCDRYDSDAVIEIKGEASGANLLSWSVSVLGGPFQTWQNIDTMQPADMSASGTLAMWDTSDLPPCAYVVRLTAVDKTIVNCDDRRSATAYATSRWGAPPTRTLMAR